MNSIKLINRILTFCTYILIISSCNSDGDISPANRNTVKVDGESFEIQQAAIIGVSMGGEGHAAISLSNGDQSATKVLTIDIEYFSEQPIEGNYSFPKNENQRILNDWLTNYSEIDGSTTTTIHLQEGTLEIVHNGDNNYTITMNLIMDGEIEFSGSYTGNFQVFFNNG